MKIFNTKSAFTLLEMVISVGIFASILIITLKTFVTFSEDKQLLILQNQVYADTSYLFERIIKDIRNGGIDYQSYWRENAIMHIGDIDSDRVVDLWSNLPNPYGLEEGSNPRGVRGNGDPFAGVSGKLNSIKNCSGVILDGVPMGFTDSQSDYNTLLNEKKRFILDNYKYQFIFPGNPPELNEPYYYNVLTNGRVHLNCPDDLIGDNLSTTSNERNIFDDDISYGRGPRSVLSNYSGDWPWTWRTDRINASTGNTAPLLLVGAQGDKRLAYRFATGSDATNLCLNGSGCILLLEFDGITKDSNGIYNSWRCAKDYDCPNNFTNLSASDLGWKDITPGNVVVNNFSFFIGPIKDAHLAFNEKNYVKPSYVTMILGIEASDSAMKGIRKKNKVVLNLQTTMIPRNIDPIITMDQEYVE